MIGLFSQNQYCLGSFGAIPAGLQNSLMGQEQYQEQYRKFLNRGSIVQYTPLRSEPHYNDTLPPVPWIFRGDVNKPLLVLLAMEAVPIVAVIVAQALA